MNILFLTVVRIKDISERGIYTDLMRKFVSEGHRVYIACPAERRYKEETTVIDSDNLHILNIKTLNIQKTNLIEKGISTLLLESQFSRAIRKYYKDVQFDLVIYSTPPITFSGLISRIKKKYNAKSYLLLKDIFPQNAVDLGLVRRNGLIHRYFRKKEKKLYQISDYIGCMSPANVDFLINNNKEIIRNKVEVNPNSIELSDTNPASISKEEVRKQHGIPQNSVVFIYGGNLGRPQGIDFLLEILKSNYHNDNLYFLIVGTGTEYAKLNSWFNDESPKNAKLLAGLPKTEYDNLLLACDVGLIFLDKRFTIPNFPSRLLSYMEYKMPVIAATDANTDMGKILMANNIGRWCLSGDLKAFNKILSYFCDNPDDRTAMGLNGYSFLKNNYLVSHSYQTIMKHFNNV
jgi:glycosyltransferase involved in cell wall biosynthesis